MGRLLMWLERPGLSKPVITAYFIPHRGKGIGIDGL